MSIINIATATTAALTAQKRYIDGLGDAPFFSAGFPMGLSFRSTSVAQRPLLDISQFFAVESAYGSGENATHAALAITVAPGAGYNELYASWTGIPSGLANSLSFRATNDVWLVLAIRRAYGTTGAISHELRMRVGPAASYPAVSGVSQIIGFPDFITFNDDGLHIAEFYFPSAGNSFTTIQLGSGPVSADPRTGTLHIEGIFAVLGF